MTNLFWGQALHVCTGKQMFQIFWQIWDVGVDGNLVLPLELSPHLSELCVCTGGRNDVIHNVDVDVVQYNTVAVAGSTGHIINCGERKQFLRRPNLSNPFQCSSLQFSQVSTGIENDTIQVWHHSVPTYVSKYDAILSWSYFDAGFDICEIMGSHCHCLWLFY